MINTWGELFAAIKTWWTTELKFERKQKLPEPGDYKSILSTQGNWSSERWNAMQRTSMQHYSDTYFESLRTRMREGEHLTADELYRLQMDQRVRECNWSLDHQSELDNNLPEDGESK